MAPAPAPAAPGHQDHEAGECREEAGEWFDAHSTTRAPRSPVTQAHFLPAPHLDHDDLKDILVLYEHRLTRGFIHRGYLRALTPGLSASEQSFALHWDH